MNYHIKNIEYYLPSRIIDNDFLESECGIDKKFTVEKVGIKYRRIAEEDEPTSQMCYKAAKKLLDASGLTPKEIDFILVCTQNPDYKLPTTACIVQDMLGMEKTTMAFDVNLGCSGFIYSLEIAGNFIRTGAVKNAIIIMADQYSRIIDYKDKNTASIFGDAAAASLLTQCEDDFGVLGANFGTDGSGWDKLIAWNSGTAKNPGENHCIFMDGREIFKFSMTVVPPSIDELLTKHNLNRDDIAFYIFHQANKYMLKELRKRMKLPQEKVVVDMENIGNTISATIPIALKNLKENGALQKGDLLIFSGFGVGLSWGNILYKYL